MTLIVNFFGGPSSGKSTMAASVFSELKWAGVNTELVTEYAKDKVWESSFEVLENQLYVFGKQYHKIKRVANHVDLIVSDSPLLNSLVYDKFNDLIFKQLVLAKHNEFDNLNFFLTRTKPYCSVGRMQTEDGAVELDNKIFDMLNKEQIKFTVIEGSRDSVASTVKIVMDILRWRNQRE